MLFGGHAHSIACSLYKQGNHLDYFGVSTNDSMCLFVQQRNHTFLSSIDKEHRIKSWRLIRFIYSAVVEPQSNNIMCTAIITGVQGTAIDAHPRRTTDVAATTGPDLAVIRHVSILIYNSLVFLY